MTDNYVENNNEILVDTNEVVSTNESDDLEIFNNMIIIKYLSNDEIELVKNIDIEFLGKYKKIEEETSLNIYYLSEDGASDKKIRNRLSMMFAKYEVEFKKLTEEGSNATN